MKLELLFFVFLFGLTLVACGDDEDECSTTDVTYTSDIASILNTSCAVAGCHVDGNEANAFFSLEGYTNAKGAADFGRMVGAINHETGFSPMPKGGDKIDQCSIDKVTAWVAAGAPE